jgi:hypothetical protein
MTSASDDALRERLFGAVSKVVDLLVAGDYRELIRLAGADRYSAANIGGLEDVVRQYGCALVKPPNDAARYMSVVKVALPEPPGYSVDMPLWTAEEGRSDLEVRLTLIERDGGMAIEFDDLLVP